MRGLYSTAMKNLRTRIISLCIVLLLGSLGSPAQTPDSKTALERGVCAFTARDYRLAETEFAKALQQDPANKLLMLFTARAIDFQVEPKVTPPGNLAKARSAIDAYSKLLLANPSDYEASSSIIRLYAQIDPAKLPEIAANEATPKQVRTGILIKLAAAANTCANDITDVNKTDVVQGKSRVYRFHPPKDPGDLAKANACASDGLRLINRALALENASETAWSYKASLLVQMSRLAEMQRQMGEKAALDKQVLAAKAEFKKQSNAENARRDEAYRAEQEQRQNERAASGGGEASMARFIASGYLSSKFPIDERSIPSRDILIAPDGLVPDPRPAAAAATPIVWKTVTAPDGAFSFLLPSPFDLAGNLYSAKGEGVTFLMMDFKLPTGPPLADTDAIMRSLSWGVADSVCALSRLGGASCEVRYAKKTSLGSLPGLEYTITTEENNCKIQPGLFRVYATQSHVYALVAVGGDDTDPRVEKFFSSLTVKENAR
jgi:tetratricopeptide (TPR) repeat protein